jgi:hypothetical protein
MLASIAVTVSASRLSLKNRGGVQPRTCSPAENRGDPVASLRTRVELLYELAADLAGSRHAVQVNVVGKIRRPVVMRVAAIRGHRPNEDGVNARPSSGQPVARRRERRRHLKRHVDGACRREDDLEILLAAVVASDDALALAYDQPLPANLVEAERVFLTIGITLVAIASLAESLARGGRALS